MTNFAQCQTETCFRHACIFLRKAHRQQDANKKKIKKKNKKAISGHYFSQVDKQHLVLAKTNKQTNKLFYIPAVAWGNMLNVSHKKKRLFAMATSLQVKSKSGR